MNFKEFAKYVMVVVVSTIATLGTLFLLFYLSILALVSGFSGKMEKTSGAARIQNHTVLQINIDKPIKEKTGNPFDYFNPGTFEFEPPLTLHQMLEAIDKASTDPKIDGILLQTGPVTNGFVITDELRHALKKFEEKGKFIVSYATAYSQRNYFLSSVAKRVYLPEIGMIDWRGLGAQIMFFKRALEHLGVQMQVIRHGKYKSAVEPFMQDKMSPANREQNKRLLNTFWTYIREKVAEEKPVTAEELDQMATGLSLRDARDAVKTGLANGIKNYPEVEDKLRELTGSEDINLLDINKYYKKKKLKNLLEELGEKDHLAVLIAEGTIVDGEGDENQIGSVSLINQIRKLKEDKHVKGVVLRINSPGGSATASEDIWKELRLLANEKPLVVSMGDVAASGGYYIAVAADKIYAHPMTITGSIGVFGVIPDISGLMHDKLKINIDTVKTNPHADMGIFRPLDKKERAYIQNLVENTYATFVRRVAEGRNMTEEKVDSIGQGRVWSGADALKLGLVDELGYLDDAVTYARVLAGVDKTAIRYYPLSENPFMGIFSMETAGRIKEMYRTFRGQISLQGLMKKKLNQLKKTDKIQARMAYDFIWND